MNETEKQIYNEIESVCRGLELDDSKIRDAIHNLVDRCIGWAEEADNPSADALDQLWKAIILKNKPDYGDWEYPGQAYRHLLAEYEELKAADPWQRIDPADLGTLPPYTEYTKILTTQMVEGKPISTDGYYDGLQFRQRNGSIIPLSLVVAWQPWPEPAPLPEAIP